jgi:soluble lytic murein transglycosylase-like protein
MFLGATLACVALLFKNKGTIVNAANSIVDTANNAVNSAADIVQNEVIAPVVTSFGTKYDAIITKAANDNGIEPRILYNLLYTESHFRDDIISGRTKSSVGALGIAQFMPATAQQELGSVEAALNPDVAIPGAARYLAKLIRLAGSVDGGVAAYNWGIGNVQRRGLNNAPPETVAYVSKITGSDITA